VFETCPLRWLADGSPLKWRDMGRYNISWYPLVPHFGNVWSSPTGHPTGSTYIYIHLLSIDLFIYIYAYIIYIYIHIYIYIYNDSCISMLNWCKGQNPIYTTLITQFRDWNRASDFLAWITKDWWNRMHFRFKMRPDLPEIYRNILCIISLTQKHQMLPNAPSRNEKIIKNMSATLPLMFHVCLGRRCSTRLAFTVWHSHHPFAQLRWL
jgi:hypothetical protein